MDTLAPGPWRRRRPEELQAPGDAKRACRRADVTEPRDGLPVKVASPHPEHRGPPDPAGHAAARMPRDGGRSPAQPCPRCVAGASGHFSHTLAQ
ncbi:uncharacterized protein C10orf143 homolog [Sorex fumeus]|uniref:uncharacterized protein C10orf143 homolog n=1 Tax=Sorex fumeus TaxID=62283 RepID=UPI0024AD7778|nr:uncharacterized protein C10orf143 homolog [Sorex fumeus]